jgi:hypothetical protein
MKATIFLTIFLLLIPLISAQDDDYDMVNSQKGYLTYGDSLNWQLEIPIWIPGFRGDFVYGDISLKGEDGNYPGPVNPIEPPPEEDDGNIFSRLFTSSLYIKFFMMGRIGYVNGDFSASLTGFTGGVGSSLYFRLNNKELVQASYRAAWLRLHAGYELFESTSRNRDFRYELIGTSGVRVNYMTISSDLNNIINRLDLKSTWTEFLIGIKNRLIWDDWFIILSGDIGNFYTGRNYSYMIQFFVYYRLGELVSFRAGWTDFDINHERVILNETLTLNVHLSGPNLGFTFKF